MEDIRIALQNLRLSGMAEKWVSLFETRQVDRLSLSDGLQLLLQAERWMHRSITTQFIDMKTTHSFRSKTTQKG